MIDESSSSIARFCTPLTSKTANSNIAEAGTEVVELAVEITD